MKIDELKEKLNENKIKLLKFAIILSSAFFILCSVLNVLEFAYNYFRTVVIFYLIIVSISLFVSEISPYILYNFLKPNFPLLGNYFGKGVLYLSTGLLYITPEVSNMSNIAGYLYLGIGVLCIVTHFMINSTQGKNLVKHQEMTESREFPLKEKIFFEK